VSRAAQQELENEEEGACEAGTRERARIGR